MKKLVTAKIVKDFANQNKGKNFVYDDNTLITPSARDMANSLGIKLAYVDPQLEQSDANENGNGTLRPTFDAANATTDPANATTKEIKTFINDEKCELNSTSYDRKQIVELVIKMLSEKGLLDKILD